MAPSSCAATTTVTIPPTTEAGPYFLSVRADIDDAVPEVEELRGPGVRSWDLGVFRQLRLRQATLELRMEAFNVTNRPRFRNPGNNNTNVSNLRLNPDGTVRDLNGYAVITETEDFGSERQIRFGVRLGW